MRVLIAEDSPMSRILAETAVQSLGHELRGGPADG